MGIRIAFNRTCKERERERLLPSCTEKAGKVKFIFHVSLLSELYRIEPSLL